MKKNSLIKKVIITMGLMCFVFGAGVMYAQEKGQAMHQSTKEYKEANKRMHHGMNIQFTGDADLDFVRGMIPHHQGAIDMSTIHLKYGKDEEMKELSRKIIQTQQNEIKIMREWLKNHE